MSCIRQGTWLHSFVILFVMKLCMSFNFNTVRNIRVTDFDWNADSRRCEFVGKSDGNPYTYNIAIYLIEFFLPALGGLVADMWFCEIHLLRASGGLLLISSIFVTAIDLAQLICLPPVYLVGLVPSCLANGIGVAPLLAAPMKVAQGQFGSATPGLIVHYIAASLGELIGLAPRLIQAEVNLTWIICSSSLVYVAASFALHLDWASYPNCALYRLSDSFHFPTKARLLRYFILLTPLVLLVAIIATVRGVTYCLEINYYLNYTAANSTRDTCSEVFIGYNSATIFTLFLLAGGYRFGWLRREGRITARFCSGAVLLLLCRAAMIPWHTWAAKTASETLTSPDPWLVHTVYASASAADGVANALALAAGYELMYLVAPAGNKNLVMGLLSTMWSVGACLAGVAVLLMVKYPTKQPILEPVFDKSNNLYAVYILMTIEAAFVLIFYRFFSIKLSAPLIELGDAFEEPALATDSLLHASVEDVQQSSTGGVLQSSQSTQASLLTPDDYVY